MLARLTLERIIDLADEQLKDIEFIKNSEKQTELAGKIRDNLDIDGNKIFMEYADLEADIERIAQDYFYREGFKDGIKLMIDVMKNN